MQKRGQAIWALAMLAALLLLLAPALWNGFPLLQWDTGGYLARPFEGYLVPSRSTVYGLFVAAGIPFNFWPIILLHAAATVWIIALTARIYGLGARPLIFLAVVSLLAIGTTLPWITAVLITDVFTGLSVLSLHLLFFASDDLSRVERGGLVALIAFAAATHNATLAVLVVLALVALLALLFARSLARDLTKGFAQGVIALALGPMMLLAANFALSGNLAWTPGGYGIVFGRMLQNGIVARYLEDRCPDPRLALCAYRTELPRNADMFLWGPNTSVFNRLGRFVGLGEEMRTIVLESLAAYPSLQIKTAVADTAEQLVSVRSGEGVLATIWHTYAIIERYTPGVVPAMRAARQQRDEIGFDAMNRVHVPAALTAIALLPAVMLLGWRRRRFTDLGLLATTAAIAILGNAAVCGVLSAPHDRYGARIAWIAVLVILLTAVRLWRDVRRPSPWRTGH